jgi:rubredoxin
MGGPSDDGSIDKRSCLDIRIEGMMMPEPTYYWVCSSCGWVYDVSRGDSDGDIEPGTDFDSLPINFTCPRCGADKHHFDMEHKYDW